MGQPTAREYANMASDEPIKIHIYTAALQPATDYVNRSLEVELRGGFEPDTMIYTDCCIKRRPAKNCLVQCYYDGLRVWCAPGCGCKESKIKK